MFVLLLPLSDKQRNTKPVIQRQMFKFFFDLLPRFYTATHQALSVLSYPLKCHWLKSIQPSSLRDSLFWWEWWKLVCNTSLGIRRFRLRQACRNHQTLCEYGGLALIVSLLLGWVPFLSPRTRHFLNAFSSWINGRYLEGDVGSVAVACDVGFQQAKRSSK